MDDDGGAADPEGPDETKEISLVGQPPLLGYTRDGRWGVPTTRSLPMAVVAAASACMKVCWRVRARTPPTARSACSLCRTWLMVDGSLQPGVDLSPPPTRAQNQIREQIAYSPAFFSSVVSSFQSRFWMASSCW